MRHIGTRFLSFILVVSLVATLIIVTPSASASFVYDPQPSAGTAVIDSLIQTISSKLGLDVDPARFVNLFSETGSVSSLRRLLSIATEYNNSSLSGYLSRPFGDLGCVAEVEYDSGNGIYRLMDRKSGRWLCDARGRFPYFETDVPADTPAWALKPAASYPGTPELGANISNCWLELAPIQTKLNSGALSGETSYSYDQLHDLLYVLRADNPTVNYRLAPVFGGSYGVCKNNLVLCDSKGRPFIAFPKKESSVTNQHVNNIVQDGNGNAVVIQGENVTTDKPIIDQSNLEFNIPVTNDNSTSVSIDNLIHQNIYDTSYNFDDHSYTVNTYDTTYNNDNRRYETNYYTWNITYNITNTYVTYIGSNDAYQQKEYEFYYELPDGRSSADLTADEVAAMSFQFADCMNYRRSATDTNLRALYHFDGDLSDAGYFSDKTAFTWTQGASITYMDSAVFDGALYLDDTAHGFDITLPFNIGSGEDFTVQWRYYQASEPDTLDNIENSVALGSTTLLKWNERLLYNGTGTTSFGQLPIGNWVELALVRNDGVIYLYLNGLKATSWTSTASFTKTLRFTFGSTSRAYSMIDELRVLNFALVGGGESYTPTSVPYDSNLVLVLPGSESVVDEYWDIKSPNNLIAHPDFTDGYTVKSDLYEDIGYWCFKAVGSYSPTSYTVDDGYLSLSSTNSSTSHLDVSNGPYGFFYYLYARTTSRSYFAPGMSSSLVDQTFTFSVVDTAGNIYSLNFVFTGGYASASFPWGKLEHRRDSSGSSVKECLFITPKSGKSIDLLYAELVPGSSPQVVATKVASVFDLSSLKSNTAAVQTDIPIHGYTVGGVRPTFPVRGDVWFGVSNGRVSTVQVYTGSAWTSSNARWWTGERWIPIYAFDIFTLEDCWDIADGEDVITPIESDTAGWNWWKKAWTDFRSWLGGVFGGGTPVEPSPSPSPTPTPSPFPSGPVIDDRPLMLASGVSIVRENADTWEAVNAASVKITLERGDLWSNSNSVKNLFVVDLMNGATSDDLFVSLDVDGLPAHEYPQWDVVSFLLYGNDDNYAAVRKASHFDGFSTAVEVFGGCQEAHGNSADNNVTSATFALHKKGNQVRVFARPLGGEWQEGETLTVDFTVNKIGFCGWRYNDLGQTATFSNLRMTTASRYALVDDTDVMLDSFMTNPVVPFFLGGGFEVLPGSNSSTGESFEGRGDGDFDLVDENGEKVSIFSSGNMILKSLKKFFKGLFNGVLGGFLGVFDLIGNGMGDFFGSFSGDGGVFGFSTYGGVDIWD